MSKEIWERHNYTNHDIGMIINGEIKRIEDVLEEGKLKLQEINLLIDRLTIEKDNDEVYLRLSDSVHTAFNESDGYCDIILGEEVYHYSNRFEADGITFVKPSANFFSCLISSTCSS